jgi:hypothetical protein
MNEHCVLFQEKIKDFIRKGDYKPHNILNMDETGVFRDSPYNSVIDIKGKKNIKIITGGHEKNRVTYVPTITMTGEELTALILLPGKGIRNKLSVALPDKLKVIYTGASSAWMDQTIMSEQYVNEVLKPFSRTLGPNEKALLILDNFSAHKFAGFIQKAKALGVDVEFLPANTTNKLQPLDLSYNAAFKGYYSALWEKWFLTNCIDKVTSLIPDEPEPSEIESKSPFEGRDMEIPANKDPTPNKQQSLEKKLTLSKFPSPDLDDTVILIKKARDLIDKVTITAGFKIYDVSSINNEKNVIINNLHSVTLTLEEQEHMLKEWAGITGTGLLRNDSVLDEESESDETWTPPSNIEEMLDYEIDME